MYHTIKHTFVDLKILRRYRPEWLDGLELNICLPDLKIGIEYQGEQHFHKTEFFGSFEDQKKRDKEKRGLCLQNGFSLILLDKHTEKQELIDCVTKIINTTNKQPVICKLHIRPFSH